MTRQRASDHSHSVSTAGGSYIEGNVATEGGEFIGRDKITIGKLITYIFSSDKGEGHAARHRREMLRLVEDTWINGVLLPSLRAGSRLSLHLKAVSELVDNHPFAELVQMQDVPPFSIEPQDNVVDVFQRAQQRLLMVGDPGSGKTTLLLLILQAMLTAAQSDAEQPIPVVLNLASWSSQQSSLQSWILTELKEKYLIPTKIAEPWLADDDLMLLLDGLDEVNEPERERCIVAINQFLTEHRVSITVCSRKTEYLGLHTRLRLPMAVEVQSLSEQQIDDYLRMAQLNPSGLPALIKSDAQVRDLASAPLMLHIMTVAAENLPALTNSTRLSGAEWQAQLFATYLTTMFHRRSVHHPFTPQQTIDWLSWLARQMMTHGQSIFLLEQMQPTLLANNRQRFLYHSAVRLFSTLLFLFTCSLAAMLAVLTSTTNINTLMMVSAIGLGIGAIVAFALILVSVLALWIPELWAVFLTITSNAVILRFVVGISVNNAIASALVFSLIGCLPGLFLSGRRPIRPIDAITWSWPRLRLGLLIGIIGAVALGLVIFIMTGVSDGLEMALMVGLGCLLPAILFSMTRGENIKPSIVPNQGIHISQRTSAIFFAVTTIVISVIGFSTRIFILGESVAVGVAFGLLMAIPIGLVAALVAGGAVCIQHYLLRVILAGSGVMPWHYQRFLDYATDRVLLRRIGGGYIFYHRLLMEYLGNTKEAINESKRAKTK